MIDLKKNMKEALENTTKEFCNHLNSLKEELKGRHGGEIRINVDQKGYPVL